MPRQSILIPHRDQIKEGNDSFEMDDWMCGKEKRKFCATFGGRIIAPALKELDKDLNVRKNVSFNDLVQQMIDANV
ncbi:hypothetical protein VNO77_25108 [Canavalia gladiata]|uniref:Uncharacterized protein n=1 Tax=Canavalia gladiata TaxID=3824 RepID=A0AAN9QD83_CANGL